MKLKFNDIGIIKEADILINGLTVLAGVNDTGKSTVGKLLYSLIKVSNNYVSVLKLNQKDEVIRIIENIVGLPLEINYQKKQKLRSEELREEKSEIDNATKIFDELPLYGQKSKSISYKWVIDLVNEYAVKVGLDINGVEFKAYTSDLKNIFDVDKNSIKVQSAAFDLMIKEEFTDQICKVNGNKLSNIKLEDNGYNSVDIDLLHNETSNISAMKSSLTSDVTYIESPLQIRENVWKDNGSNENSRIYLKSHQDDLLDKLSKSDTGTENILQEIERKDKIKTFENMIAHIIGGEFNYKEGKKNFIYTRNGNEFRLKNTATGIKVFAIIKLLLNSGSLKKNSILIIDEPEVHLHPQWQMDYAELLVMMVKELGIKVLVNSHSPYMIEAFKVYSDHHGIADATNFYMMKRAEDYSEVKCANDCLGEIFTELSEPFSKLDTIEVNDFVK